MKTETFGKLFTKVATLDPSARVLASVIAMNKQASVEARKQYVKNTVAGIVKKAAFPSGVVTKGVEKANETGKIKSTLQSAGKALGQAARKIPSVNAAMNDIQAAGKAAVNTGKAAINPSKTDTDQNTWAPQLAAQSLDPKVDSNAARTMRDYLPPAVREPVGDVRGGIDSAKTAIKAQEAADNSMADYQRYIQSLVNKYMSRFGK